MVEGFAKVVKYLLFSANVIIFIGGITVFSIGVWTLSDKSFMERLLGSNLYVASAAILIATGVVVAIISFLGTLGAYREIRCMLITFFVILFMIFIVMLVGGILGYIFRSEVDERMHTEMITSVKLYGDDVKVTDAWDAVQRNLHCCGILPAINNTDGGSIKRALDRKPYEVWFKEGTFPSQKLPLSCCLAVTANPAPPLGTQQDPKRKGMQECSVKDDIYRDSCYEKMKTFVKGHALLVGGLGIGIACVLVLGMILSCALFLMIR